MRSQGLPSSFLPAHLGINYDPPSPLLVLCDGFGFMSAGISRRSRRSARHFVNLRSTCSRFEVDGLSASASIPIHLGPFTRCTEDSAFTAQTCYVSQTFHTSHVWMVWMLRASAERAQKELTGRSPHHNDKGAFRAWAGL